jgi:methylated-DNA-protein-cysteine methyltransferase related protein
MDLVSPSAARPRTVRSFHESFYAVVRRIPRGRVATYGDVAIIAGYPRHARHVGVALRNLRENAAVPWHRVVNARGEISLRSRSDSHELQRILLEAEGVEFSLEGRIDLRRYGWRPPEYRRPTMRPPW